MYATDDPGIRALADQEEAELHEARRLAPHNRFMLSDSRTSAFLDCVLKYRDPDAPLAEGPAPILWSAGLGSRSVEVERIGSKPFDSRLPVRHCNACNEGMIRSVPFWVARAHYVVQVELCGTCAQEFVLLGAVPQVDRPEHG